MKLLDKFYCCQCDQKENLLLNSVRELRFGLVSVLGLLIFIFVNLDDMNAIVKVYGSQIIKNNEPYMVIDKLVVDFVVKGARFKVKDVGVNQLSK